MSRPSLAAALLCLALGAPARAEYIFFDAATDTVDVSGQTVLGSSATFEAIVMFPTGSGANGAIFEEHLAFGEDKQLQAGPSYQRGFAYSSPCCLESTTALAPDVFHHVAYVLDGAANEERLYLDGSLVASRATAAFDVSDADGTAHIGATDRDGGTDISFVGYLDTVRISDVARYTGASFAPPTGDLPSDANTLLLYNFDDPPGSTTVADSGPLGRTGTLGQGFAGATSPAPGASPFAPSELGPFLCYKAKSTKGSVCSTGALLDAGAACENDGDCGGEPGSGVCVPNAVPKGLQASLADPKSAGKTVDVKKGAALCNPADVAGAGIASPDDHLRSFGIAVAKGGAPFPALTSFTVTNAFGQVTVDTGKVDRLLVPAAKDLAAPVPAPETPAVDHFRCAKVKVSKGAPKFEPVGAVSIVDQFSQPALYDLKKPTRLCSAVDKNGEGFVRPADLLLCYQAKRGKGQPKHVRVLGVHVAHQFGLELLDTVKEEELCVPSDVAVIDG